MENFVGTCPENIRDNDTSNARDANRAKLLTDTTCQVVTRNATRAEARKAELERTNACELAADEKQITDAQINFRRVRIRVVS